MASRTVSVAADAEDGEEREQHQQQEIAKSHKRNARKGFTDKTGKGNRTTDPRARPASAHTSRAQTERAAQQAHQLEDEPWVPPSSLPDIPVRPGFVHRWVRVGMHGQPDPTNAARRFREGWVPRKADSVAKGFPVPKLNKGEYAGFIGVEGMILCEMSEARNKRRNAHYQEKNLKQRRSIDDDITADNRHGHPGFGPIRKVERSRLVREVAAAGDE